MRENLKLIYNSLLFVAFMPILCTALVVNNELASPTVSGKYVWFGITLPVAILSAILIVLLKRKTLRLSFIDFLLSIFCLWGISYSYYLTQDFSLKLILLLFVWMFYVTCRLIFSQQNKTEMIVLFALVIIGLIEAIWGTGQLHNYYPSQHTIFRTTGSFYNPGPYAGFLAIVLPIALHYILVDFNNVFNKKFHLQYFSKYLRWFISAITLFFIITILPSAMSRAAWIAAICGAGLVLIGLYMLSRKDKITLIIRKHKQETIVISGVILLILGTSALGMYHLKKDSADGRTLMWKISSHIIFDHPFGVGIGHFAKYYGEYQINYFSENKTSLQEELVAGSPEYAFNEYLQIGIEHGVIPLIVFISISGIALYSGFRQGKYGATGALLSLLVFAFFSYPFSLLPFLLIFAVLIAICTMNNSLKTYKIKIFWIQSTCLLTTFIIIAGFIIYNRYPTYEAYREWRMLKMLNHSGIDEKQSGYYKKDYPYLKHEPSFLFEYAQCLNKTGKYGESNRILEEMKNISCDPMIYNVMGRNYQSMKKYTQAEESFRLSSLMIPSRLYPYYLLMKLYKEQGDSTKMKNTISVLLQKEAKINSPAIQEMREEARKMVQ